MLRSVVALLALLGSCALGEAPAKAGAYPAQPVRIIVPYPPGGPTDIVARTTAQKLAEKLGGRFYVENLPGAGGTIGTSVAAGSSHDGSTILAVVPDFLIQPLVRTKVPYDPVKSFVPVTLAVSAPEMISVNSAVPAKNFKELVELLRANPGKFQYATPGVGTPPHLYGESIYHLTLGLDVTHVPFQGAAPALNAAIAGQISILNMTLPTHVPYVRDGKLHGLAVLSSKRSPVLPDVPTLAEAGKPGQETDFFVGFMVPAGTPRDVVELLNREITTVLTLPDVKQRWETLGLDSVGNTPEEFAAKLRWTSTSGARSLARRRLGPNRRAGLNETRIRRQPQSLSQ
jgi:tripartite-type tricarboxylate transporter receptor subunit TctC